MNMPRFKHSAIKNNEGIAALLNGNQSMAIQLMGQAVDQMKRRIIELEAPHAELPDDEYTTRSKDGFCFIEIPGMKTCDTVVCNQAIRIPAGMAANPEGSKINVYVAAVIYNLGLAHQFGSAAISTGRADILYCHALKLLKDRSLMNNRTALFIKLACISNLSQIRCYKGEAYQDVSEEVQRILHSYQASSFMSEFSSQAAMPDDPEIRRLLLHVVLLSVPVSRTAACAA